MSMATTNLGEFNSSMRNLYKTGTASILNTPTVLNSNIPNIPIGQMGSQMGSQIGNQMAPMGQMGQYQYPGQSFNQPTDNSNLYIILGVGGGVIILILISVLVYVLMKNKEKENEKQTKKVKFDDDPKMFNYPVSDRYFNKDDQEQPPPMTREYREGQRRQSESNPQLRQQQQTDYRQEYQSQTSNGIPLTPEEADDPLFEAI